MNEGITRSVYMPGDLDRRVSELAEAERRSFSNMVVLLLEKALGMGEVTIPCPVTEAING